jgi:hypothetical protein
MVFRKGDTVKVLYRPDKKNIGIIGKIVRCYPRSDIQYDILSLDEKTFLALKENEIERALRPNQQMKFNFMYEK